MFLENIFMKKCLKCGVEYQDDDIFCPVCDEKLTATNVCQKCGKPVSAEETYCRHCGYKIEKEIKCEQCGADIEEGAKFCPQCGAKVENPIVTVKSRQAKSKTNSTSEVTMNPVLNKVLFYVFGGVLLLLISLMFIGCFGDIARANISGRPYLVPSGINQTQGISYFFSNAFESINQAKQYDDKSLANFLTVQYVFDLLLWLSAIALFAVGIALGTINLAKGAKNEYKLKTKPFVYGLLGGLPYLFIFALKNRLVLNYHASEYSSYSSYASSYTIEEAFGWGAQMILVCTIIGVFVLVGYNILTAVFNKKDIVKQSIRGGIAVALTIALLVSIGFVVFINMKDEDISITGMVSSYYPYIAELTNCSANSETLPGYATLCLISYILVIFGYGFVQAVINNILNEQKNYAPIVVNGACAIILLIAGHAFGVEGFKKSVTQDPSSTANYTLLVSAGCIVITLFVITAIVGYMVSDKVGKKKQEPQIQQ